MKRAENPFDTFLYSNELDVAASVSKYFSRERIFDEN